MTERMEPTNRLRYVERGFPWTYHVLQQLWRETSEPLAGLVFPQTGVLAEEWRDVPTEEG